MGLGTMRPIVPAERAEGTRVSRDLAVAAAVIVGVLAVSCLPYLYAYRSAPPGKVFMGILLNVPDTAQYFSWARESSRAILIENMLTPERGPAAYFNLFWLVVGRLSVDLHLGIAETTQVIRPLVGAFFLGAIYWYAGRLTADRLQRWASFLVVTLGSGLGWVLIGLKQLTGTLAFPQDVYTTEPNTFLSILAFPLQAMADGLLVVILGLAAMAFERKSLRLAAVAGLLSLLLGAQHGYDLIITYAVVGATGLFLAARGHDWRTSLGVPVVLGAISAPAALYVFLLARLSPIWRGVLAQYGNAGIYTPPPWHLLVLMGLPLILLLVIPGDGASRRDAPAREVLLRVWLVVGFLLLYIPTDFNVKMLGGWQIPVGLLAARAVTKSVGPALTRGGAAGTPRDHGRRQRRPVALGALLVVAVLPTTLYLFSWRFTDLARHDYPYYLSRDEVGALEWLGSHSQPSDVVLSSLTIGQYIPYVAGDHAFLAHWAETLDYYHKSALVQGFFADRVPDTDRLATLRQYRVRFVVYSASERNLGAFDPDRAPYLRRIFENSTTAIYRVDGGPG